MPMLICRILYLHDIVRRGLVNKVVKPVGKKQRRVSAPGYHRALCIVVTGVLVFGHTGIDSRIFVAQILPLEGVTVVLRMTRKEYLTSTGCYDRVNARLL